MKPRGWSWQSFLKSGLSYKSIVEGIPYLIDDVTRFDASFHLQPPYDRIECLRSRSFIICPIKVKGETIGALAIDNKRTHRLMNESDLDTIMLFADEIAGAVTRIKLLTSIDTLTSELDSSFAFLLSPPSDLYRPYRPGAALHCLRWWKEPVILRLLLMAQPTRSRQPELPFIVLLWQPMKSPAISIP